LQNVSPYQSPVIDVFNKNNLKFKVNNFMKNSHIFLIKKPNIDPAFIKANGFVLKKYREEIKKINNSEEKMKKLEDLWLKEFSGSLHYDNTGLVSVNFSLEKDLILFILKWTNSG
jgi:hypothetical protein